MPTYRVTKEGFRHGRLYHPQGKRPVITEVDPFTDEDGSNPRPSWIGDEVAPAAAAPTAEDVRFAEQKQAEADASQTLVQREESIQLTPEDAVKVEAVDFNIPNSEDAAPSVPVSKTTETLGVE